MHLSELKALPVTQLVELAMSLEIDNASRLRKQELMFAILKKKAKLGEQIFGDGVLEVLPDGFGFLRSPESLTWRAQTTFTSRLRRFAGSTCTLVTPSKERSAPRKKANAILPWSRLTRLMANCPRPQRTRFSLKT